MSCWLAVFFLSGSFYGKLFIVFDPTMKSCCVWWQPVVMEIAGTWWQIQCLSFTTGLSKQEDELEEATLDDQQCLGVIGKASENECESCELWVGREQSWYSCLATYRHSGRVGMSRDIGAATLGEREISAWFWSHRGFWRKYERCSAVSIAVQFSNVSSSDSGINRLFFSFAWVF